MPVLSQVDLGLEYKGPQLFVRDLHNRSCDWSQMGLLLQRVTDVLAVSTPISL